MRTNGVVPRSAGIDTEMQCGEGFSHTKGWLDIWIQIIFDINYYWFFFCYHTFDSRFFTTANIHTGQPDLQ